MAGGAARSAKAAWRRSPVALSAAHTLAAEPLIGAYANDTVDLMKNLAALCRMRAVLGSALLLAAPAAAFALGKQGIEPAWLPGAAAYVMVIAAIRLIVPSLAAQGMPANPQTKRR